MQSRQPPKPSFFWQGLLILLPVLVLAMAGVWTLRVDRAAVERDARAQLETLARATLAAIENFLQQVKVGVEDLSIPPEQNLTAQTVSLPSEFLTFKIRSDNSLDQRWPVTWPPKPLPLPDDLSLVLTSNKHEQWILAEAAFAAGRWLEAAALYLLVCDDGELLQPASSAARNPVLEESRFRAMAQLRRANALERGGQTNEAMAAYSQVIAAVPGQGDVRSESGLPMTHLAALKILDLAQDDVPSFPPEWRKNPRSIIMRLAEDASPFGGELLYRFNNLRFNLRLANSTQDLAECFAVWEQNQGGWLRYHQAAEIQAPHAAPWPEVFWVGDRFRWVAVSQVSLPRQPAPTSLMPSNVQHFPSSGERLFAAIPEENVARAFAGIRRREDPAGRFAVRLVLAEREFVAPENASADWTSSLSSNAHSDEIPLTVSATLANPSAFFAAQQRRQWLFSGLLLLAAGSCAVGYVSARRAFHRQLRLNEMKSNFVSSVSHELRAPIASVRLMAENLERGKIREPEKQQEYFRFITQECRRLSSLIANVLDFARIEQNRKEYEFEPTDIVALVEQTVKLMEPCAAEKGVSLKLETFNIQHSTFNLELKVDGRAIQQALVNLIDNAIKHSQPGAPVRVGLEYSDKAGPSVLPAPARGNGFFIRRLHRFSQIKNLRESVQCADQASSTLNLIVEDSGPGIPSEERERIFERFHRLGSELRRETQGIGIGLSIVRHIVQAHGGTVHVESEPGKGSRFVIELPSKPRE